MSLQQSRFTSGKLRIVRAVPVNSVYLTAAGQRAHSLPVKSSALHHSRAGLVLGRLLQEASRSFRSFRAALLLLKVGLTRDNVFKPKNHHQREPRRSGERVPLFGRPFVSELGVRERDSMGTPRSEGRGGTREQLFTFSPW